MLPIPSSHPLWKKYQILNAITNIFSGINYALALNSIISALSNSVLLTGALNFIYKDVIGQLFSIFFAYTRINKPDENPIKHGIIFYFLIQIFYLLDNITPFFPKYFLLIAGLSSIGKNVCMIAIGSVNVKCIEELSNNNMGKVYSKIASQNSFFSSMGMGIGGGLCILFPEHLERLYMFCPIISFLDILSYYFSIQPVLKEREAMEEYLI